MKKIISVAIPVLNERECLRELHRKLVEQTQSMNYEFEWLFIDDGSTDDSYEIIRQLKKQDQRVSAVKLSRNFGHQTAFLCGLEHAKGDAIILMDADLQHPPELIPKLVEKWEEGFQIVNTIRLRTEGENFIRKVASEIFYHIFSSLSGMKTKDNIGDFRLIDRTAAQSIKDLQEHSPYLRGLISWIGFKQTSVPYIASPRFGGEAKYNLPKLLAVSLDGITSFSIVPLRLATLLGILIILFDVIYFLYVIGVYSLLGNPIQGWTSLTVLVSLYSGIQLLIIGVLGEYIAKIHIETKKRPRYIVAEKLSKP